MLIQSIQSDFHGRKKVALLCIMFMICTMKCINPLRLDFVLWISAKFASIVFDLVEWADENHVIQ